MNDLHELLATHDPAREAHLTDDEKRRILSAVRPSRPPFRVARHHAGALASLALLALFLAALFAGSPSEPPQTAATHTTSPSRTRELQLTTPGGTRVIWVFRDGTQARRQ